MADTKTYQTTPQKLQALSTMLASHGIAIDATQPSGDVKEGKWDIAWSTPAEGQTTFTVKNHPFGEEGIMWSKLDSALA